MNSVLNIVNSNPLHFMRPGPELKHVMSVRVCGRVWECEGVCRIVWECVEVCGSVQEYACGSVRECA